MRLSLKETALKWSDSINSKVLQDGRMGKWLKR